MENYAQHLRTSTASKEIFPNVALGFTDSVAAVREETVKVSIITDVMRSATHYLVLLHRPWCCLPQSWTPVYSTANFSST